MFTNERRRQVERRITRQTIYSILRHGYKLHSVSNGEDNKRVNTATYAMELAFACDDAHIFFTPANASPDAASTRLSWLYIVLGNEGWTVISDYTVDLEDAVRATDDLVDAFEQEDTR